MFGKKRRPIPPPHPRRRPRLEGPLTLERVKEQFSDCVDFGTRELSLWDRP